MNITRINHVQITIPPGAEDQARAFYCEVLGLTEIEKPEALKSRGGLWLQLGDQQVHIGTENGVDRHASKAHIAYEVDDLTVWRERLTGAGVNIDDSIPIPGYERFECRDPFGNRLEMITPMKDNVLQQQVDYYRARAGEYDEWFYRQGRYDYGPELNQQWADEAEQVRQALYALGPVDTVLELACGTGIWTQELLKISEHVTALDASPEVIAINRAKLNTDPRVTYAQVDLFAWEPAEQVDVVFFGFWLSHVPPDKLDEFLAKVARSVSKGGHVFIVDSQRAQSSTAHDHSTYEEQSIHHTRKLNDGREFTIIKIFHDPAALGQKLAEVGFQPDVHLTDNYFIYGGGVRT
jgi:demethylmenaquinone methyltransferase/2-methoxy-6-polyprenyl-1,4-benzoquinol methylase